MDIIYFVMGISPIILGLAICFYTLKYIRKRYIYASKDWVDKINNESNMDIRQTYSEAFLAIYNNAYLVVLNKRKWGYDHSKELFYIKIGDGRMEKTFSDFINAFYEDYDLKVKGKISSKKMLAKHIENFNNANHELNKIYKDIENETI